MNKELISQMARVAMENPERRASFVEKLRANPEFLGSLKSRVASEEVTAEGPLEKAKKTLKEFEKIIPELKKVNLPKEIQKTAANKPVPQVFSPATKALVEKFNGEYKALEQKYAGIHEKLKAEIKVELKAAMDGQRALAKEKGLQKEKRKKFLVKSRKKIKSTLMKKVDQAISDFKKEQKALVKKYADKDPDFRKASGFLNLRQRMWRELKTPYQGLFYSAPLWIFLSLIVLRIALRVSLRSMVV